jgi:mono/diheme cytochrome c family protein
MMKTVGWFLVVVMGGWFGVALGTARGTESGKSLFEQRCASCHGKDGQAQTGAGKAMHIKAWRSDEMKKMSDEAIHKTITEGVMEGGKRRMPANKNLKPEQVDELVKDVRNLSK